MPRRGVAASPNSPSFQELWEVLGSKLMDAARGSLSSKQVVAGSSPVSRSSFEKRDSRSRISPDSTSRRGVGNSCSLDSSTGQDSLITQVQNMVQWYTRSSLKLGEGRGTICKHFWDNGSLSALQSYKTRTPFHACELVSRACHPHHRLLQAPRQSKRAHDYSQSQGFAPSSKA